MGLILHKQIRNIISKSLKQSRHNLKELKANKSMISELTLENIDSMQKLIMNITKECHRLANKGLHIELSVAKVNILAMSALAFAVYQEDGPAVIDPGWAFPDHTGPAPNLVLKCLLTVVTNRAISIISLIEVGQDGSARILLRNLSELCYLIPILITDREKFITYVTSNKKTDYKVWKNNFSFAKLKSSLKMIEEAIGMDDSLSNEMESSRKDNYKFYSQIMHNNYATCAIQAYSESLDENDESIHYSLFGYTSRGSRSTLYDLIVELYVLILSIYKILVENHNFKAGSKNELWIHAVAQYDILKKVDLFYFANCK